MSEQAPELRTTADPVALLQGAVAVAAQAEDELAATREQVEREREEPHADKG